MRKIGVYYSLHEEGKHKDKTDKGRCRIFVNSTKKKEKIRGKMTKERTLA
jgi:hypothetical protein